ncbi:MAG: hypothetical protein H7A05_08935 [Pseudomonadales bacterium]|nr:hypothetical protein [Pseudomonadales bacterium]MCP5331635.1 hypothetical protein [Pseudomonadales bacterium]MCP5344734.1 hypothetical protein [Pseudomonadales bacterium]
MNLNELQAFLEECNWDEGPLPSQAGDPLQSLGKRPGAVTQDLDIEEIELSSEVRRPAELPRFSPAQADSVAAAAVNSSAAVRLVPRPAERSKEDEAGNVDRNIQQRLVEVEMAQRMGYLLCKCTWPPQVMVLTGRDHVYRCRRCSRVREM